jgi:hypothetical protein
MPDLDTTNLLLGIMAVVSVLEGLLILAMGIGGWMAYRKVMLLVAGVEERQIAPVVARVNGILDEVQVVASTVRTDTERVEHAIRHTIGRVDHTANRVRADVRTKTSWVVGAVRGVRVALREILKADAARARGQSHTSPLRAHS